MTDIEIAERIVYGLLLGIGIIIFIVMLPQKKRKPNNEWSVRESKDRFDNKIIVIESEDFSHDASLVVTGDFVDKEQHIKYAESLAVKLNNIG